MSRSDQPGFRAPIPGNDSFDAHADAMSAPGSLTGGRRPPADPDAREAVITPPGASLAAGDRVTVGRHDTQLPSQTAGYAELDFTGQPGAGDTGAGSGQVVSPRHPNNPWAGQ